MKTAFKTLSILSLLLALSVQCGQVFGVNKYEWKERKSDHFIVYYHPDISKDYLLQFVRKCEKDYNNVLDNLGFSRSDFWLFEDRVKIVLFKNNEDFLNGTGAPDWTGGFAQYKGGHSTKRVIVTFYQKEWFLENILPHELSHIMLYDFTGKANMPRWFDEGVAVSNEKEGRIMNLLLMRKMLENDPEFKVRVFENGEEDKFYAVSTALVAFLLEEYGQDRFVELCKKLKNKRPFGKAFRDVYGFNSFNEFFNTFLEYSRKEMG